ncbi:MAG TPA: hypothetical protein VK255_03210 [Patescibacteria group bacterium]|nr:hypothetical protein [Patescibacteria group bacterium]
MSEMKIKVKIATGHIWMTASNPIMLQNCQGCQARIFFAKTEGGKFMPISTDENGDFISHFADCPVANRFRNK